MNNIGILDPLGENLNPLTNEPYSDQYKKYATKWSKLPAYSYANEIIQSIKDNQVLLIISSTGSGKTVLLPKFTLHTLDYNGKIIVTLPRKHVTSSAAEYSALTLDVKLGDQVGYKHKDSDKKYYNENKNKLLYATDGTVTAKLLQDPNLTEYSAVIIDEAHERKIQIDELLYLLRNILKSRPEFKLIIMSATINEHIFKNYFTGYKFKTFDVGGERLFPIKSIFLDRPLVGDEYIATGLAIINDIIKEKVPDTKPHDILFFVTSVNETFNMCKKLNFSDSSEEYCIELYADMNLTQKYIVQDKDEYKKTNNNKKRKIIIATNAAESSLTIDGIEIVIDSGQELFNYYDPDKKRNVLTQQFITMAQATQRMGRTGRTGPGTCYHLYTQKDFENLKPMPEPEIKTCDITSHCLKFLSLNTIQTVSNLKKMLNSFIEPPLAPYINDSIDKLTQLKLISQDKISELGLVLSKINTEPTNALILYTGWKLNCYREVLAIVSMLDAMKNKLDEIIKKPMFGSDMTQTQTQSNIEKKFNSVKKHFAHKTGDHITLLNIYNKYIEFNKKKQFDKLDTWIYNNFLKNKTLANAKKNYYKLMDSTKNIFAENKIIQLNMFDVSIEQRILTSIYSGLKLNIAKLNSNDRYDTAHINNIRPDANSFILFESKLKPKLVYGELFTGTNNRTQMLIVSTIPKNIIDI